MAENTLGRRERMMLIEFIEKWVDLSGVCDAMVDGQLSQLLFQCLSDGWDEPLANQIIQSCRDAPGGIVTYEELMAYQLPPRQEISLLATDGITLGQNIPFDICHFPFAALASNFRLKNCMNIPLTFLMIIRNVRKNQQNYDFEMDFDSNRVDISRFPTDLPSQLP